VEGEKNKGLGFGLLGLGFGEKIKT